MYDRLRGGNQYFKMFQRSFNGWAPLFKDRIKCLCNFHASLKGRQGGWWPLKGLLKGLQNLSNACLSNEGACLSNEGGGRGGSIRSS